MIFQDYKQSLCWVGDKVQSPYPDTASVSTKRILSLAWSLFVSWAAVVVARASASTPLWMFLVSAYLSTTSILWPCFLTHDGHLRLNYSNDSLGTKSKPVIFIAVCLVTNTVCSGIALNAKPELQQTICLVIQFLLSIMSNIMISILQMRFQTHGMSFTVTPGPFLGRVHLFFFGNDTAFCQGLDRWEDAFLVDGSMENSLKAVGYIVASLFNVPVYVYFRYNSALLGSKSGLRFTASGAKTITDTGLKSFSQGNSTADETRDPIAISKDFHTQLLDRTMGDLVDATLGVQDKMLVSGKAIRFVALSHTWAKSGSWQLQEWKSALNRSLGSKITTSTQYCWIDSLCIDQKSPTEVATAVANMGRLYRAADSVLVQDLRIPDTQAILLLIARLTAGTTISLLCTYLVGRSRAKVSELDPWYTRIWTLQEGRLAQRLRGWSEIGLNVSVAQLLHSDSCFALDTGLSLPDEGGDLYEDLPSSDILQMAQRRYATKENDKMYGLFGLLPVSVTMGLLVDYNVPFNVLYSQVISSLIEEGDHSLLGGSEGILGRGSPRWMPPFGKLWPLFGPCKLPGNSTITPSGLKLHVRVIGVVQSSHRTLPIDFSAETHAELISEAYVGMNDVQFEDGVWQARQYYKEDYNASELEDLRQLVLRSASERGGLHTLFVTLSGSAERQRRIGWADSEMKGGDIVVARCLDNDGGSLGVWRSEGEGYVQVGGIWGGTHVSLFELPVQKVLLVS